MVFGNWQPAYFSYIAVYSNPVLSILVFVPMIIGFSGLLFKSRYSKINLYFAAVILVLMFLSKGLHPPLENINLFLYEHIPGFFVFIQPLTTFYLISIIPLALLIGSSCNAIGGRLKNSALRHKGTIYNVFILFVAGCFLVSVFPMLTGNIIPDSSYIEYLIIGIKQVII